jgi:hypothetical protein
LATVYRTLPMLLDSRLIRDVELNREHRYYEVNREQSPASFHIVCADCHEVVQVQDECITLRERFLANSLGFKPMKLTVRIEAACLDLLEKGSCIRQQSRKSDQSLPEGAKESAWDFNPRINPALKGRQTVSLKFASRFSSAEITICRPFRAGHCFIDTRG